MLAHRFFGCARGRMMGPDYGAVDDEVLHVGVIDEMLVHTLPYAAFTPSGEPFVDAVPVAVLGWKRPPLCAGSDNPQDRLDEPLTFGFLSDVHVRLATKELKYLWPLFGR